MLFLRKRDAEHRFWRWASDHRSEVPAALLELVRDKQVVIEPVDAAEAIAWLHERGFRDEDRGDGNTGMPAELVDGDGRRVIL